MSPAKRVVEDSTAEEYTFSEPSPGGVGADPHRETTFRQPRESSERDEFVDVPAAVVCAYCGDPDCPGCAEERSRSGVIAIVAWERSGSPLARLWSTAKASTESAEAFFETLPDGGIMSALRFAVLAEFIASAAMLLGLGVLVLLGLFALGVVPSVASLILAGRIGFVAVAGLTVLLVAAHATHGYALDLGARATGAIRAPTRALRFGLYATGWDLMLGPVGFFGLLFREGPKSAFGLAGNAMGLPTRCSLAFLRGAYGIQADRAKPALHASYLGAGIATALCVLVIAGAVVGALLR